MTRISTSRKNMKCRSSAVCPPRRYWKATANCCSARKIRNLKKRSRSRRKTFWRSSTNGSPHRDTSNHGLQNRGNLRIDRHVRHGLAVDGKFRAGRFTEVEKAADMVILIENR